jgi:hypothetical protein
MSKRRVSSPRSKTSGPLKSKKSLHRFIGISLSGGKQDKACMAVLEYYPEHDKVFLVKLHEKIKNEDEISADAKIINLINSYAAVDSIAFDVPLHLPQCMVCKLKCPGQENCKQPHIKWMQKHTNEINKTKRPRRTFTPYTQRCSELILNDTLEESFHIPHALGSNSAPLLARAHFLSKRLKGKVLEVFPKLSVYRIGRSLKLIRSHLMFHKHAVGGDESRLAILNALSDHGVVFVYKEDIKIMVENNHAFESFISALTAFFKMKGLTEPRPRGFPEKENWIEFPVKELKL